MFEDHKSQTCINCKWWNRHQVHYDYPEDECGSCGNQHSDYYGETTYGDDEACGDFSQSDRKWDLKN